MSRIYASLEQRRSHIGLHAEAVPGLPCPAKRKFSINLNSGTARAMLITLRG